MNDAGRVIIAHNASFCFGIRRVLDLIDTALHDAQTDGGQVYALGWPLHNEQVVDQLVARGLRLVDSMDAVPAKAGVRLVLRAHGEPAAVVVAARARGLTVIDATCPLVQRVREAAEKASSQGRAVVCAGRATHPEVVGILSCVSGVPACALSPGDALPAWDAKQPVTLLPQTTIPRDHFMAVFRALTARFPDTRREELRCRVVDVRQTEAMRLAARVDLMLIVGSAHSANTCHLQALCAVRKTTVRVLDADELASLPPGTHTVGIVAGTSTPPEAVMRVAARCRELLGLDREKELMP